jgi:predicted MPP superfamily phosphohydrolase
VRKLLKRFYFPQTVAYPEQAEAWQKCRSYRQRERRIRGKRLDVVSYTFPARRPAEVGKVLCFLSDFHYMGTREELECRRECVDFLREVSPDLLLLGGDLCGDAVALPLLPGLLDELGGVCRTLAVPGNWERRKNWLDTEYWRELYGRSGIHFLSNESWEDDTFFVYGTDDLYYGRPADPPEYPGKCTILLTHAPDMAVSFGHMGRLAGVDLILAGHTHGGQIRFPLIGPLRLPSLYGTRFDYGEFRHRQLDCRLIVTAGMGHLSFPKRFNCKRELVEIRFTDPAVLR